MDGRSPLKQLNPIAIENDTTDVLKPKMDEKPDVLDKENSKYVEMPPKEDGKPKNSRLSLLKAFDPLAENSEQTPKPQKKQLIIEDSDLGSTPGDLSDVSEDNEAFVDARNDSTSPDTLHIPTVGTLIQFTPEQRKSTHDTSYDTYKDCNNKTLDNLADVLATLRVEAEESYRNNSDTEEFQSLIDQEDTETGEENITVEEVQKSVQEVKNIAEEVKNIVEDSADSDLNCTYTEKDLNSTQTLDSKNFDESTEKQLNGTNNLDQSSEPEGSTEKQLNCTQNLETPATDLNSTRTVEEIPEETNSSDIDIKQQTDPEQLDLTKKSVEAESEVEQKSDSENLESKSETEEQPNLTEKSIEAESEVKQQSDSENLASKSETKEQPNLTEKSIEAESEIKQQSDSDNPDPEQQKPDNSEKSIEAESEVKQQSDSENPESKPETEKQTEVDSSESEEQSTLTKKSIETVSEVKQQTDSENLESETDKQTVSDSSESEEQSTLTKESIEAESEVQQQTDSENPESKSETEEQQNLTEKPIEAESEVKQQSDSENPDPEQQKPDNSEKSIEAESEVKQQSDSENLESKPDTEKQTRSDSSESEEQSNLTTKTFEAESEVEQQSDSENLETKSETDNSELKESHSEEKSTDIQKPETDSTIDLNATQIIDKTSETTEDFSKENLPVSNTENNCMNTITDNVDRTSDIDNDIDNDSDTLDSIENFKTKRREKVEIPSKKHLQNIEKKPEINKDMADLTEKINEQQQEISDLKLQLNALQQARASLELEVRQKEEIVIKTQAESLKKEQEFRAEIKDLKEKLKENSRLIEKSSVKELEEQLKEAREKAAQAINELKNRNEQESNVDYKKIMEEYEKSLATKIAQYQELKDLHDIAEKHLANLELAFSDVHQKYERAKALIAGYKTNEETLKMNFISAERTVKNLEERYESLKTHAKNQIDRSNKEIISQKKAHEEKDLQMNARIKRLEILCKSLEVSLEQKQNECLQLAALCDDITGKK